MDWYKSAQEETFSGYFDDDIEESESTQRIINILNHYGKTFEIVKFHEASPVLVFDNDQLIDDFNKDGSLQGFGVSIKDTNEWLSDISDLEIYSYIASPEEDPFWDTVGDNYKVYHGTTSDRLNSLVHEGIEPRSESRGLSNKWTPSGVFTSPDYETADRDYDAIVEIDVGKMKSMGAVPEVGGEDPLEGYHKKEALAHMIGVENYYDEQIDGDMLSDDTLVFFGMIPSECVTVIKPDPWTPDPNWVSGDSY
jgi:hypothetical protein